MSDYIKREDAIDAIKALEGWKISGEMILAIVPTVDVVEVVRCKDCRWKQGSECVRFADVRPFPDDFCSRAERRTDEQIH